MTRFLVEYARKTSDGWREPNYELLNAEDRRDASRQFCRSHQGELYQVRKLITFSLEGRTDETISERGVYPVE